MSIETIITHEEPEEREPAREDWENFNKEVEKCPNCEIERGNANKNISNYEKYDPNYFCANHQEIYRDMTGSVI